MVKKGAQTSEVGASLGDDAVTGLRSIDSPCSACYSYVQAPWRLRAELLPMDPWGKRSGAGPAAELDPLAGLGHSGLTVSVSPALRRGRPGQVFWQFED